MSDRWCIRLRSISMNMVLYLLTDLQLIYDCPTSIEEVDGEIVPAERIMVLTVTVMVAVFDTGSMQNLLPARLR